MKNIFLNKNPGLATRQGREKEERATRWGVRSIESYVLCYFRFLLNR